jgi:tetratricopeptide (TPR) repeat protein
MKKKKSNLIKVQKSRKDLDTIFRDAMSLDNQGKHLEALSLLNYLLKQAPNNPLLLESHGMLLLKMGRFAPSLLSFDNLLSLNVKKPHIYSNRGIALKELKRTDEAIQSFNKAIAMKPDYVEAYVNLGNALKQNNEFDKACACYEKAISLNSTCAEAYYSIGNVLKELKDFDRALSYYDKAIKLKPDFVPAYCNKSILLLLLGEYPLGWSLFEWRFRYGNLQSHLRDYPQKRLMQQSLKGKTILLYPEQGLGDTIQFCRYAKMLADLGANVILEVQNTLHSLISSLDQRIDVIPYQTEVKDFDYHSPLMSLPLAMNTTINTIPSEDVYLYAIEKKVNDWKKRLGEKQKYRIGLVWQGSSQHMFNHNRSIPLKLFAGMFSLPLEFHCLQKEIQACDLIFIRKSTTLKLHNHLLQDFSETAALIMQMDLIISVDTSVAHLAGALGKPVWILLAHIPDYRWMLNNDLTPWYPSARLFRQNDSRGWESVITEVIQRLQDAGEIMKL